MNGLRVLRFNAWLIWGRVKPYLKPTFIVSFGIAWMITNGWSYVLAFAPLPIPVWLRTVALSYIGFLFLPTTLEKPLTFWIAIRIQRKLFMQKVDEPIYYNKRYKRQLEKYNMKYKGEIIC